MAERIISTDSLQICLISQAGAFPEIKMVCSCLVQGFFEREPQLCDRQVTDKKSAETLTLQQLQFLLHSCHASREQP